MDQIPWRCCLHCPQHLLFFRFVFFDGICQYLYKCKQYQTVLPNSSQRIMLWCYGIVVLALCQKSGPVGAQFSCTVALHVFPVAYLASPCQQQGGGVPLQMQGQQESVTSGKGLYWTPG